MYKIRYSNCWEDTDVILAAINAKPNGNYISIASAGDNTLALLTADPDNVLAVDMNPSQIAALEIRKAAFQILEYDDLLKFVGVKLCKNRLGIYVKLRHSLSANSRYYWDKNPLFIEEGLIHCGRVESYLKKFRTWILPFLISKKKRRRLFHPHPGSDHPLSKEDLSSWRWHLFTRLFFSKLYLAKMDLGRSKFSYQQIKKDIAGMVLERIQNALTAGTSASNPYLEYVMRGNYVDTLPYYLEQPNFEKIRVNLPKLQVFTGSLEQCLRERSDGLFDGFNLSDIFEYMDAAQFKNAFTQIVERSRAGARIVYWNNLIERVPEFIPERIKLLNDIAAELFKNNRSFFYASLVIAEAVTDQLP